MPTLDTLERRFDEYHTQTKALATDFHAFQNQLDDIELKLNRPGVGNEDHGHRGKVQAYKHIGDFVRTGDESALRNYSNAWTTTDDSSAGYTVFPAISPEIRTKLFDAAPMYGLCRVVQIGEGGSWQEVVDTSDADASWVGEQETRSETSLGTVTLNNVPLEESTALVKLTQRIVDDSNFDLGGYVVSKLTGKFARLENAAITGGSGVKQPKGFLTYPTSSSGDSTRAAKTYQYVPSGHATQLTADGIINLYYSLRAPYRQGDGAAFVMSSDTARQARLLKDGNGQYLWAPSLAANTPDRLCGLKVVIDETMPSVGAGALSIALANWPLAYVIIERDGMRFLRDPYSAKPYLLFYATRRCGGQSSGDFDSLKLLKVATS